MTVRPLRVRASITVGDRHIRAGTLIRSDDPIVEGREHLLSDVMDDLGISSAKKPAAKKQAEKGD
jgi:hypothetical protein